MSEKDKDIQRRQDDVCRRVFLEFNRRTIPFPGVQMVRAMKGVQEKSQERAGSVESVKPGPLMRLLVPIGCS